MFNIFEHGNVVSNLYPSDMQTAVADDWIDMKDYHAMDIVWFKGAGTGGDDLVIPLGTFARVEASQR
jgi:hypothetical protein